MFLIVEDNPDLLRDASSKSIINNNREKFLEAKKAKEKRLEEKNKINKLETEMKDIKILLTKLLEKIDVDTNQ